MTRRVLRRCAALRVGEIAAVAAIAGLLGWAASSVPTLVLAARQSVAEAAR